MGMSSELAFAVLLRWTSKLNGVVGVVDLEEKQVLKEPLLEMKERPFHPLWTRFWRRPLGVRLESSESL